jgi:glycerophosphoryl diester phosphodiesterase
MAGECLIPVIGPLITRFLDGLLSRITGFIRGLVSALANLIMHPIKTIGDIVSLFRGCPDDQYNADAKLQVISHHGYTKEYPENTRQACRRAVSAGANALEIDVCFTKDGHAVLWHDWDPDDAVSLLRPDSAYRVDKPPLGSPYRKPVIQLTLAELREHYTYVVNDALAGVQSNVDTGNQVETVPPTLDEFLDDMPRWEKSPDILYLDIKMPATAVEHAAEMTDKIIAAIGDVAQSVTIVAMVPELLVLRIMKARAAARNSALLFTWDIEFPPGIILNPWRYSAIDHATGPLHGTVASVGRPAAALVPVAYVSPHNPV